MISSHLFLVRLTLQAIVCAVFASYEIASAQGLNSNSGSLPATLLYPKGKVFPFIGFSGNAQWQKENGYTAFGPVYGDEAAQQKALGEAKAAGLPFIYRVGLEMHFLGTGEAKPVQMKPREIQEAIARQAGSALNDPAVCWWYVTPEELRFWVPAEMSYLEAASKALDADPMKRPLWMYEPNERDAGALVATGKHQGITGKGFYANYAGFKDDRVWIRWSAEQEVEALKKMGRPNGLALVMPELAADPDPADVPLIPAWVRHDVYSGLINGCKGVAIWSLFKRKEVAKTHEMWMTAYATVAKELTGEKALGQVFLFGERKQSLKVTLLKGPAQVELELGKARGEEASKMSAAARRKLTLKYPSLSTAEIAFGNATYLILCNDTADPITVEVKGFSPTAKISSAFDNAAVDGSKGAVILDLSKWGVTALRFQ